MAETANPPMGREEVLAQKLEETKRRLRREQEKVLAIQEIGRALGSTLNLDDLLELIMTTVTRIMDADRSTLFLVDDRERWLWSKIAQGNLRKEIRLPLGQGVAGWVAKTGRVLNIKDAYQDERFNREVDQSTGYRTRSILAVPVKNHHSRCTGVIEVLNKKGDDYFSPDDEALLDAIASQVAISVENSKLYLSVVGKNIELTEAQEKLEQKNTELDLLFEMEREIVEAKELDGVLDTIISRAMAAMAAEAGSILLIRESGCEVYMRTAQGRSKEARRRKVGLGKGVAGWVAQMGKAAILNDPAQDERYDPELGLFAGLPVRNIVGVPLIFEERVMGALEIVNRIDPSQQFSEDDVKLLTLLAGQASRAIQSGRAKEEAKQADQLATIGQMLSGVLHDFKTPMTIISGYVQLMARQTDDEERQEYSQAVLRQFDHMNAMIREILAFARGERNIFLRKVYLHRFMEEMTVMLEHEFAGTGITFVPEIRFRGAARFDETKIRRVVFNIARNARQAMPNGGSFTMGVDGDDKDLIFTFTDTGQGVPQEIQDRLFESFVSQGKKDGTGLGLAIVRKIVEEHGGTITFTSFPSAGTTFLIRMPAGLTALA